MDKDTIIKCALEYIEEHLESDLNLDEISEQMGYSKFYLNRMFVDTVGGTIYKYIHMRRLTEAARKLVETEKTIVDIAFEANYQSQQAFTNAFSLSYHVSPQIYRNRGKFSPKKQRFTMKAYSQTPNMMYRGMAA